ncbi:D-amino-acid transaminase [Rhizobium leguminosarum]|jgi:D-alanine transaminase|uniref:D-amino-acid transaminase n=1 Tax=Rhizobium leguminosarum TaxID=384 RepID=UPI000DE1C9F8|nr:D-amino-acid transaminase [Rhizobium leguminosarum]MBY2914338.1 D-amino-acid transaminase [Rhizobium leguminosarum]MBY2969877.1 D-amino-acid transaminase [Rhizobium leguminosarum]MBY2977250.1 D-amino-acid transaminase [Rhizobium leguminosarum]MBY2986957.1 D-amino-acid transaminase [Rhizobium leguminosarum]MBY2998846.1 D-amino-acid transaminase [Rhizobium leguminosarum]
MRQVYVNGDYLPETEARISVFDRGFLFADGVYEVTLVLDRKLVDFAGHMRRLRHSLGELDMAFALTNEKLLDIHRELIRRNDIEEGLVYLQVTRGAADRDFLFPADATPRTLVVFTQKKSLVDSPLAERGLHVITVEDLRWRRCDIKTVQLLYPSMAKMEAKSRGADDAWMVRDGFVTEGSSNNAYIVTLEGTVVTRDLSTDILRGITREAVLQCAQDLQLRIEERPFTVEEVENAAEAFSTSSSGLVSPVVRINERVVGKGTPGPMAARLRQLYLERSRASAI